MLKSVGPNTDPCGTPDLILCCRDRSVSIFTWNVLSVMKDMIVFNRYIGRLSAFSFISSPRCQTLSKACVKSRKTAVVYFLFSKPCTIISDIRWIWWHVECCVLKPNWYFGIMCKNGFILFNKILSYSLDRVGNRLIGL